MLKVFFFSWKLPRTWPAKHAQLGMRREENTREKEGVEEGQWERGHNVRSFSQFYDSLSWINRRRKRSFFANFLQVPIFYHLSNQMNFDY